MRKFNPAINTYKTLTSIPIKDTNNNNLKFGLLAPKQSKTMASSKKLQPVEKAARLLNKIKMQREAYKNGEE